MNKRIKAPLGKRMGNSNGKQMLKNVIPQPENFKIIYIYPMLRHLLIFLFCLAGITAKANAQTPFSGRVLENKTRIKLRGVRIENLNTHVKAITGEDGGFSIAAKVG